MKDNSSINILLADDDESILELLEYNLVKEGYVVHTASNGQIALDLAKKVNPDLIILDVMMPEMDGIEACHQLRELPQFKNTLITFLSARTEDYTQISGYEAGSDDYIEKPIRPRLFLSRIKALLKRRNRQEDPENAILEIGIIRLDRNEFTATLEGKELNLVKKEFELLSFLMSKPRRVFTRAEIIDRVWESDVIVGNRTIDVHIRKLREKIGSQFIETVKGVGYKFVTP